MKILVIDGQGGRLGALLVEKLKKEFGDAEAFITAVGTNSVATTAMLKAGADAGATGEYPVVCAAEKADIITGPLGAAVPGSLLGEVTPVMAEAVGRSRAEKVLVPGERCSLHIAGAPNLTLAEYADETVRQIKRLTR